MASEILSIPEDDLGKFIEILRDGILAHENHRGYGHICRALEKWCREEEEYLLRLLEE